MPFQGIYWNCNSTPTQITGMEKKMATEKTPEVTSQNDGWTTVSDGAAEPETKIVMENINDQFVGLYLGMRTIGTGENAYQQARWEVEGQGVCFMNANWSLREGLSKVRARTVTRVTLTDFQDTGKESLMSVYKVEIKGTPVASARSTFLTSAK